MKTFVVILLLFCAVSVAMADSATPKEVVDKCKEAAALILKDGAASFPKFNDKNGSFVWKDSYVFVFNMQGIIQTHPIKPDLRGQNLMGQKDVKGKLFTAEFVKVVKTKGSGWVEYYWENPITKKIEPKSSYVMKVNDTYFVGAGVMGKTAAECEKEAK